MPDSVAAIIKALGGVTSVAQHFKLPVSTVGSWMSRNRIPDGFRPGIIDLASVRNVGGVTFESITLLHARPIAGRLAQSTEAVG